MLSAIILAAGSSSRMGRPKALLEYNGLTFLENVCAPLRAAGVRERVAVLGRAAGEITGKWKPDGEKVVLNPEPELGQLSSLRAGIAASSPDSEGFIVCLVDQPTILAETYKRIIAFWTLHKDAIVIPRCFRTSPHGAKEPEASAVADPKLIYKRGHPIIIPAIYRDLCFEGPLDKGLHWVTHHPSVKTADLTVEDPGIIRDFDTPEDYDRLRSCFP